MSESAWDVIVAGGSGAGLSAALMLGRSRRRVVVVDGGEPRNRFSPHMHGVLGHDGVVPGQLLAKGHGEASRYGVEFLDGSVVRTDDSGAGLSVTLQSGKVLRCRAFVVATGIEDDLPDIPGLRERWGTSVLHCPYCHGWEVRDRRLAVLATSPLAVHQVQLVRQLSDRIVFFFAGAGQLDPETARRLRARDVELVATPVVEVIGDGEAVSEVRTADGATVPVDAIFTMGTPRPRDGFLKGLGLSRSDTPFGSFLAVDETGRTSNGRIWAAGNVTDPTQNVATAMGAGNTVGAMVNMALVAEDFDNALAEANRVA